MSSTSERTQTGEARPPDWSPVPEPPGCPLLWGALYALAGLLMAGLLWATGHPVPGAILSALILLGGAAAALFPRLARAADRARETVQRVAGRVLAVVLLGGVQVFVFFPASLVLWILRIDPLAPRGDRGRSGYWQPAAPGALRPLHRRQFTYEPDRLVARRERGGRRLRAAVGAAALLLLADLAGGAVLHRLDHSGDAAPSRARQSLLVLPHIDAGRGDPWLPELAREIDRVWYDKHFDPFLGWAMPGTFAGRWLNITDGVRRSYEPRGGRGRTVTVDFLGGSALFGLFQRDDRTIPSDIARLAEADGIRLRVANYGRMAYNNWQESLLLSQLVASGRRPDLAVFYDGNNELVSQFRLGPHLDPQHQEAHEYARRIGFGQYGEARLVGPAPGSRLSRLADSWKDLSAIVWLERRLRGVPTEETPATQSFTPIWIANQVLLARTAGIGAAAVYGSGVRLTRTLARGDGFRTAMFWQPIVYSKPVVRGEEAASGSLGTDPSAWRIAYTVAQRRLAPGVFDIAGALDRVRRPVMFDFVHTNEEGAEVVARAMYRRLRPMLLRLRGGAGPSR